MIINNMKKIKIGLVLLSLLSINTYALEFKPGGHPQIFEMVGDYDEYSIVDIKEFLYKHPEPVLIFPYSKGGAAQNVLEIQNVIKDHGNVGFYVDDKGFCYSMCAWTALAANRLAGEFNFHGVRAGEIKQGKYVAKPYQQTSTYENGIYQTNKELQLRAMDKGIPARTAESMAFTNTGFVRLTFTGNPLGLIDERI